jgi:hypothetical protein
LRQCLFPAGRIPPRPIQIDTAKRQVREVKPLRTNTPMHALTALNNPTYVEVARFLADATLRLHRDETTRFDAIGIRLPRRKPAPAEVAVWKRSLERACGAFQKDPAAATNLLATEAKRSDPGLDPAEHAARTALCLNLLNLDETLTKE